MSTQDFSEANETVQAEGWEEYTYRRLGANPGIDHYVEVFGETRDCIYYEGDDPAGFAREMKERGLNVQVTVLDAPVRLIYSDQFTHPWGT